MSWRDDLRPASFRGVGFHVADHETPTGRRLVVEDFPERDTPGYQDMGKNWRDPIRLNAFVWGPDYMARRDALLDAIENSSAPGELVHPYLGRMWVSVGACTLTESAEEGGLARFQLVFHRRAVVERQLTRTTTSASATVAAQAAQSTALTDAQDAISGEAPSASLASRLAVALVADEQGVLVLVGLPSSPVPPTLDAFADAVGAAITSLDIALAVARRDISIGIGGLPAIMAKAWSAYQRLVRVIGVRRGVEIAVATTYTAADDAEAAARQLAAVITEIEAIEDSPPDVLEQLRDVRVYTVSVLTAAADVLPRLKTITVTQPTPAVVLAYNLYGDASRAEEIVARNAIANPGFCAGELEVLAS